MRRFFLPAAVLLVASIPAKAQDHPSFEIFGGYSYLNTTLFDNPRNSLHGWGVSVAGNLSPKWGLVAEFSGHNGQPRLPGATFRTDLKKYTYLFGPRFSARTDKATAFGHVLVGGATSKVNGVSRGPGFALGLGGGLTST